MNVDSGDLKDYIVNVVKAIKSSENEIDKELGLKSDIKFELSVVHTKSAGGGIKIIIANAEGKYQREDVSKISFSIGNRLSLEDFEKISCIQAIQSNARAQDVETIKKLV